ncbi:unnamed protein product [Caretta caretta]
MQGWRQGTQGAAGQRILSSSAVAPQVEYYRQEPALLPHSRTNHHFLERPTAGHYAKCRRNHLLPQGRRNVN